MATKQDLKQWVVQALVSLGGAGTVTEVAKVVWEQHSAELETSGDLFYTWQYDLRWAATKLRHDGVLRASSKKRAPWMLIHASTRSG